METYIWFRNYVTLGIDTKWHIHWYKDTNMNQCNGHFTTCNEYLPISGNFHKDLCRLPRINFFGHHLRWIKYFFSAKYIHFIRNPPGTADVCLQCNTMYNTWAFVSRSGFGIRNPQDHELRSLGSYCTVFQTVVSEILICAQWELVNGKIIILSGCLSNTTKIPGVQYHISSFVII